jgi:hypothetical protein
VISESKDSTIMLDVDETLLHVTRPIEEIGGELTERMEQQSPDLFIRSKGVEEYDPKRLEAAYDDYRYKDNVVFFDHPDYGSKVAIILRPGLCEFLHKITSLPPSAAQGVVIFTANRPDYARQLVGIINQACNVNIPVYSGDAYHPDSVIIDDHRGSAQIKLLRTKVGDLTRWVEIEQFRGDLRDDALKQVLPDLIERL